MEHLVNWIEIPVSNMKRAVNFYGELLGLELHEMTLEKTFLSKEAGHIGYFSDTEGNKVGLHSMD
jgi:predicted enzyme related to lactoylglutathione lyase